MTTAPKRWGALNRAGGGSTKAAWLIDPDGNKIADVFDSTIARQIAAAMNLIDTMRRINYAAEFARFGKAKEQ